MIDIALSIVLLSLHKVNKAPLFSLLLDIQKPIYALGNNNLVQDNAYQDVYTLPKL